MCLYNDTLVPRLIAVLDEWNVIKDLAKLVASYLLCTAGHYEWDDRGADYSIGCACTEERQFKGFRLVLEDKLLAYKETILLDPTLRRAQFDDHSRPVWVDVYRTRECLVIVPDAKNRIERLMYCEDPRHAKAVKELLGLPLGIGLHPRP